MSSHRYRTSRQYDENKRPIGESWMPYRPFFWSLEQIASMLGTSANTVKKWCFFRGRSTGVHDPSRLLTINMAPPKKPPYWCVEDREFRRYLKNKGIRMYGPYLGRYAPEGPIGDARTPPEVLVDDSQLNLTSNGEDI